MNSKSFILLSSLLTCVLSASVGAQPSSAPSPAPTAVAAATPAPNTDVRMIRMKLSAGDLPSAESILENHLREIGKDGDYTMGVAWVARGAALIGDWKAAAAYSKAARQIAEAKLTTSASYETEGEAVYALGTAIEVDAQALVAAGKKREAIKLLDASEKAQEKAGAPYNLRARIWKRRNQIELVGRKAPPFKYEDCVGVEPLSLPSLKGRPVVLFFWWESCGDCKGEAAAFRKVVEKYAGKGVAFLAPTRYYGKPDEHAAEKGRIEKSWTEFYALAGKVPVPISDEGMLRYGVSATPTFVLLDSAGVVRLYSPTRMTEERLSYEIEKMLR
jgi:thiol-disulfide isomerase/thioredoxin